MALESATYLNTLNSANPPAGDPIANAADHIRLIKAVLQATFPNVAGPVSASDSQLSLGVVPTGGIIMWTGTTAPSGWGICSGATYPRSSGVGTILSPNLYDQFIIGAGDVFPLGGQGGSSTVSGSVTISGTALTVAQLPSFSISISDPGHTHGTYDPGHLHGDPEGGNYLLMNVSSGGLGYGLGQGGVGNSIGATGTTSSATTGISIQSASTGISASPVGLLGQTHTHTGTFSGLCLPPYYALAFIMKL